jgi:hypothetical protein
MTRYTSFYRGKYVFFPSYIKVGKNIYLVFFKLDFIESCYNCKEEEECGKIDIFSIE